MLLASQLHIISGLGPQPKLTFSIQATSFISVIKVLNPELKLSSAPTLTMMESNILNSADSAQT